ncbi:NADH-quinone oxidoreductase subunit K [Nocardioides limicola]|uniref:NADH-quinone oxidoreductase subunit K n=1 Tax=Nocardioides limicola TaxID=2803368 RepID=UPI00193C2205|nr:NADH-quinone oxidoreductase subunit K [Nocardioides sp. DJM-14]
MTREELFLAVGAGLAVLGAARLLLTRDLLTRVLALNVASGGVLMILVALALRGGGPDGPDPVLHALVLTGIVITVSVTGFAIGLVRRIEGDLTEGGRR